MAPIIVSRWRIIEEKNVFIMIKLWLDRRHFLLITHTEFRARFEFYCVLINVLWRWRPFAHILLHSQLSKEYLGLTVTGSLTNLILRL